MRRQIGGDHPRPPRRIRGQGCPQPGQRGATIFHLELTDQDLSGARFTRCQLPGAVIRGSDVTGMDIDDRHLYEGPLWVNGVDVVPIVESELDSRFPGRLLTTATTPAGLCSARAAAATS